MIAIRWALALALGLFLISFGVMKFTGSAHIFPYIEYKAESVGFPMADLFYPLINYATGVLEILAGALVVVPATRSIGSKLAVLPLLGAFIFHLSPLLGIVTPAAYATPKPDAALAVGGPFVRTDFSPEETPVLFAMAAAMLVVAIVNLLMQRPR